MNVCVGVCAWELDLDNSPGTLNLPAFKAQVYESHLFWRELLKAIFQFDVCISHHLDSNLEREDYFVYSLTVWY